MGRVYKSAVVYQNLKNAFVLLVVTGFLHCTVTGMKKNTLSGDLPDSEAGLYVDTSVEDAVKSQIDKLYEEGKLTEVAAPDSNPNIETHFWLYEGKVVKVDRRWRYVSKAEFYLPVVSRIDSVVLTINDDMGSRIITNHNEINTIYTILIEGSVKTDTGHEVIYQTEGYSISNSWKIFEGCQNDQSTLKIFSAGKENLSISILYNLLQSELTGEHDIDTVKRYRACIQGENAMKSFEFENPVLNTIINRYVFNDSSTQH